MIDFAKVLLAVVPSGRRDVIDGFAASMERCIAYADLSTPNRLAGFIGQCAEESASFRTTVEYASGRAYNGRIDLGNIYPGDGPRFKGRGLIQLTGRANYRQAGKDLGLPLEGDPETAAAFPDAALIAAWYWKSRGLNRWADVRDWRAVTLRVNGGERGLSERELYTERALHALADLKGALLTLADQHHGAARAAFLKMSGAATTAVASAATGAGVSSVPLFAAGAAIGAAAAAFGWRVKLDSDIAAMLEDAAKDV
ncbi:hypothetical protein [Rhodoblastus sp.]|uniref:glycoside hydrolase family 19 protein n=1 Tax=Rhodoblastus sp. TaxID=1962975 RepID=UPI0026132634|nr:hypothetical protein [Rhodoblastus sp.]